MESTNQTINISDTAIERWMRRKVIAKAVMLLRLSQFT
jgi:hypothetical protein